MKALTFSKFGSPDVLEYLEIPKPLIKANEILLENKAIGLNFADIYRRKGNYHLKGEPPFIAGYEGAGIVSESKSDKFKVGDRVAYTDVPFANAEFVLIPETHAIPIPYDIEYSLAASVLLQGLTAQYLANDSYSVKFGEVVLIHAASGGVGQILIQLCKLKGAIVIGLSRNIDKLNTILDCKADYAIELNNSWKSKIMQITNQKGVDVVFDSVGSTLMDSFEVTKERGHVVFYGMSGGDPKAVDPRMLMDTSKTLTGGDLWSYLTNESERKRRANELFVLIKSGAIKIKDPVQFKLAEGKKAHEFLENGESSSKVLLIP
ncbi:quinone oxidoreductase family protein [Williamwhitmania taraxaci]|uniref:NADPH2:quinone reductase n=1 Tax=Williamwhitmania taraxaci TaxID=1640674 RepID=A0A1G6PVX8_9BACT|nr:quinone oxidoreductase [Williamwhitmania taraxaci]SDC84269.1 NADPH2:quinone reductase [Williamwhitmania taraxaci]